MTVGKANSLSSVAIFSSKICSSSTTLRFLYQSRNNNNNNNNNNIRLYLKRVKHLTVVLSDSFTQSDIDKVEQLSRVVLIQNSHMCVEFYRKLTFEIEFTVGYTCGIGR